MKVVYALVERFERDDFESYGETKEIGPLEYEADDDFESEDIAREGLEESGEHVLCVWTVEA